MLKMHADFFNIGVFVALKGKNTVAKYLLFFSIISHIFLDIKHLKC